MQIDPKHVTANDIRRYEKLMSGKAVKALSNAQSVMSCDSGDALNSKKYFTKHHWILNQDPTSPIEIEFERPTSLISLNIELTFNCKDTKQFIDKLSQQQLPMSKQPSLQQSTSVKSAAEDSTVIDTSAINLVVPDNTTDVFNLGLLNIHGAMQVENGSGVGAPST